MSMEYIRRTYKVPAKRGCEIEYLAHDGELLRGKIVGAVGPYIRVRIENNKHTIRMHPTYRLKYLPDGPCFDDASSGDN